MCCELSGEIVGRWQHKHNALFCALIRRTVTLVCLLWSDLGSRARCSSSPQHLCLHSTSRPSQPTSTIMLHLLAATNRHCWQHVCAFATAAAATTASAVSTTHLARHLSYYATAHQADASAAIAARSSISRRWSAAGAAAAAALLWGASTASPALADAADGATPSSSDNSSSQGSKQARFTEWLTGHGADMSAVAVHPSSVSGQQQQRKGCKSGGSVGQKAAFCLQIAV